MQVTKNYSYQMAFNWTRTLSRAMAKIGNIPATVSLWQSRQRERQVLQKLEDHHLRDIGITKAQAMAEASTSFSA